MPDRPKQPRLSFQEQRLTQLECELEEAKEKLSSMEHYDSYNHGILIVKMVRCGKSGCRCERGMLHGPYTYYQFRDEHGKLHQKYLNKKIVDKTVDIIRANTAYRKELSHIRALQREIQSLRREVGVHGKKEKKSFDRANERTGNI